MLVEIVLEDQRWVEPDLPALADAAASAALSRTAETGTNWVISVLGCSDARIAALNGDFRGTHKPTNVLSWPSVQLGPGAPGSPPVPPDPSMPELGDIAIAYETCRREADTAGISFADHVIHLLVHGTLHLLGYDHENDEDAALMEGLETEILATLGVPNPY